MTEVILGPRFLREIVPPAHLDASQPKSPLRNRRLRAYSLDPTQATVAGGVATLKVPAERLAWCEACKAIVGERFAIMPQATPDGGFGRTGDTVNWSPRLKYFNLDDPLPLSESGYGPSLADEHFIAQMVYTVASALDNTMRTALGRLPLFGLSCDSASHVGTRMNHPRVLALHPWGLLNEAQACFSPEHNAVHFGFYKARQDARGYPPGSIVFAALSHDVIVHELSHAYLDSVFPCLAIPVNDDVLAFHEAFADLMAIFQRLTYSELVKGQIAEAGGKLDSFSFLATLATGLSQTALGKRTLRQVSGETLLPDVGKEPHARGDVLVQAVYRAFDWVLSRRLQRVVAIATAGTHILPPGALAGPVVDEMARLTVKTALMFQSMMIRALDHGPPLGLDFYAFLCAAIAADSQLVPDDPENVREAWMEAFRFHRIFPTWSCHYSSEALVGNILVAAKNMRVPTLSLHQASLSGDPAVPPTAGAAMAGARAMADALIPGTPLHDHLFTTQAAIAESERDKAGNYRPPFIDDAGPVQLVSMRSFARPGPGRRTELGTVVQLVQASDLTGGEELLDAGAATLVFDSAGLVVSCATRPGHRQNEMARARNFADSVPGQRFWGRDDTGRPKLRGDFLKRLCEG